MNNQNKNFKVFSGIRSFLKLENGYVSVTDVETKVSVVEDYKVVYDILKIILTEQRFNVFLRELSADKEEELVKFGLSKELTRSIIEERYINEDSKEEFFLNW